MMETHKNLKDFEQRENQLKKLRVSENLNHRHLQVKIFNVIVLNPNSIMNAAWMGGLIQPVVHSTSLRITLKGTMKFEKVKKFETSNSNTFWKKFRLKKPPPCINRVKCYKKSLYVSIGRDFPISSLVSEISFNSMKRILHYIDSKYNLPSWITLRAIYKDCLPLCWETAGI